ncbi:MAG: prepilin-type N-terminal cleavage/methylation domain-containing protein [Planctomycetota bacterium]
MKSIPVYAQKGGFTQPLPRNNYRQGPDRRNGVYPSGVTAAQAGAGFTLIEVIIAMILLTVGLMTLLSVTLGGMLQREVTREYDIARNAASAKIEEIRAQDFDDVAAYTGTYFAVVGLTAPTGWTNPGFISVNNTVSDLYDVTVTIRWRIQGNTSALVYNEYVTRTLMTRRSKY